MCVFQCILNELYKCILNELSKWTSKAALLKKEGQAAAQLVLHNHMSGIDATNALSIDALHRLEKAKSTTTERIAELKEVNLEYV